MSNSSTAFDPNSAPILIVDDDPLVLSVLQEQIEPEGFPVTAVEHPKTALDLLQQQAFSIVMAGHEMSGMSGLEFLAQAKELRPNAIRLLVSSTLALKELLDAVKSHVIHRFLGKPWLREELTVILRNSVACQLSSANVFESPRAAGPRESGGPAGAAETVETAASQGVEWTPESAEAAVAAFVKALGAFHPNLGNSAIRTAALCRTVGKVLSLPADQAQSLVWAGALRDIALVGVDRGIVRRWVRSAEKCTDEEMALIRRYPIESQEMLKSIPAFSAAADIVRGHRENWDGAGYPDRLKGEMIPWLSRLLAVAVHFCSRYQAPPQILNEIQGLAEKMFDPQAVEAIARAVPLTQLPRGEREVLLAELQPGMVLARDIYNTSGVLVVAKGKELTTAWINKIMAINNATPINPLALVYC